MSAQSARAYRSHLQPACLACRRRKSRCHNEAAGSCLMCQAHGTECVYPPNPRSSKAKGRKKGTVQEKGLVPASTTDNSATRIQHPVPVFDSPEDQQNLHIVGPAGASDSLVLSNYLSRTPGAANNAQNLVRVPASRSRSVFFTRVDKRPVGAIIHYNPATEKLGIIERIIEPWGSALVDLYFTKVNPCFPIIEEAFFRQQLAQGRERISPALLACIYAHALVYWPYSDVLRDQHCPNGRYIWNLAIEAVYSELHLQPSLSIIQAILLNVGGRPTTSLVGNAALLGAAVSMANSLGLNRNPSGWDMPLVEKTYRMRIWWTLLFHDRWCSLTHGTPPRISRDHYDVPAPTLENLCHDASNPVNRSVAETFIALMSLTEVLEVFLQRIYRIQSAEAPAASSLEVALNRWVESLKGDTRYAVVRGNALTIPGSANLRLSYLTTRLLAQRIMLESAEQSTESNEDTHLARYFQARQTAEEIVISTREFGRTQLGDFWPSVSAFVYPATVSFLLRCALEGRESARDIVQDASFKIARDLLDAIRQHRESHGWDLAELCLSQHSEIMERILNEAAMNQPPTDLESDGWHDFLMSDTSILDQFFPSFWDQEPAI